MLSVFVSMWLAPAWAKDPKQPPLNQLYALAAARVAPGAEDGQILTSRGRAARAVERVALVDLRLPNTSFELSRRTERVRLFVGEHLSGTAWPTKMFEARSRSEAELVEASRLSAEFRFFAHETALTGFQFEFKDQTSIEAKRELIDALFANATQTDDTSLERELAARDLAWYRAQRREHPAPGGTAWDGMRLIDRVTYIAPNTATGRVLLFDERGRLFFESNKYRHALNFPIADKLREQGWESQSVSDAWFPSMNYPRLSPAILQRAARAVILYDHALVPRGRPDPAVYRLVALAKALDLRSTDGHDAGLSRVSALNHWLAVSTGQKDLVRIVAYFDRHLAALALDPSIADDLDHAPPELGRALGQVHVEDDTLRFLARDAHRRMFRSALDGEQHFRRTAPPCPSLLENSSQTVGDESAALEHALRALGIKN